MALTPSNSTQYAEVVANPSVRQEAQDWDGNLIMARGTLVLTATGTGTANMLILPAGRKLVYPHLSVVSCPDGTANSVLSVGHLAYTTPAGPGAVAEATVNADIDAFASDLANGAGALVNTELDVQSPVVIDSKGEVVVTITIETANGGTGTYELDLAYAKIG